MTQLLTTRDVATYLGVPVSTIYQWRTRGAGPPAARVGRHLRWRRGDVDQWIADQVTTRP